jgi:hypothetical protein
VKATRLYSANEKLHVYYETYFNKDEIRYKAECLAGYSCCFFIDVLFGPEDGGDILHETSVFSLELHCVTSRKTGIGYLRMPLIHWTLT